MSYKILALEGVTENGKKLLEAEGWSVDVEPKPLSGDDLKKIVGKYDAMLVRSGSKITEDVLAEAKNLKVIGRGGVGVDNVDLKAATRKGIMVMNSPQGNMVSTAELALAMMLGLARNLAPADASMKSGTWDRKSFAGVELQGKRLGVVGFGRIGREVAARGRAFGMEVVAYDPFVAPAVAESMHVTLLSLDELIQTSDYVSLHSVLTPETKHLIGKDALAKAKKGIRIVNAARGELIDDEALLEALETGKVAGAGLDVYAKEPPVDWRLAKHPRVLATPHVGASTKEAQERVGTDICIQVRDYMKGGVIQNAVNFFSLGGDVQEVVGPAMDLAERLGRFLIQVCGCGESVKRVELGLYGDFREIDPKPILSAALAGVLTPVLSEKVTFVNALALAKERGIDVGESSTAAPLAFPNLMALRVKGNGTEMAVAGTIFGRNHFRLVNVDGIELDAIPQGHLLVVKNEDRPGIIGHIGTLLGKRSVNIARMTVGRNQGSAKAIMILEVDNEVSADVLKEIAALEGIREVKFVNLG
jgi:D-3-phosphoglycerate dehydrogenase / 2-oxoglutarate reductase